MTNIIEQLAKDENVLRDALEKSINNTPDIDLSGRELDLATREAEQPCDMCYKIICRCDSDYRASIDNQLSTGS